MRSRVSRFAIDQILASKRIPEVHIKTVETGTNVRYHLGFVDKTLEVLLQ